MTVRIVVRLAVDSLIRRLHHDLHTGFFLLHIIVIVVANVVTGHHIFRVFALNAALEGAAVRQLAR